MKKFFTLILILFCLQSYSQDWKAIYSVPKYTTSFLEYLQINQFVYCKDTNAIYRLNTLSPVGGKLSTISNTKILGANGKTGATGVTGLTGVTGVTGATGNTVLDDVWGANSVYWQHFVMTSSPAGSYNPWNEYTISTGTRSRIDAESGSTYSHEGITRLVSAASTANSGYALGFDNALQPIIIEGGEETYFCFRYWQTGDTIRLGFMDGNFTGTAVPTNAIYISLNGNTVKGICSDGGSVVSTSTSYTASTNTWYRAKIIIASTSSVTFTLYDDSLSSLWSATISSGIPSGSAKQMSHAMLAIHPTSEAAKTLLDIDYVKYFRR